MATLRLSEIWIYPIKSLGGIRLQEGRVLPKGLEYDRRWMLVDENGLFLTQRRHPQLALFQVEIKGYDLIIQQKQNLASHRVSISLQQDQVENVTIWDDMVSAHEVSAETSEWFSDQLNKKCKLVCFPEPYNRPVDPRYVINREQVSLADGYPFLIIGQASLDDLNSRMSEPLTIHRFRPNFVFTGGAPYEEDNWKHFSIGENRFRGVKNCSRCVLTTVNPDTGEKGVEPLRTLSSYRKRDGKVYLGQNLVAQDYHYVNEGDLIKL